MNTDTKIKSTRIFIPSNWTKLKKLTIDGKPIGDMKNHLTLLKYLLHCCYTAQYYKEYREDGFPFSYARAATICKGDKKPFSKLRKVLMEHQVITCDEIAILGQKSYHYCLGPLMEETSWKLSHHKEDFILPLSQVEQSLKDHELTIDHTVLPKALEYAAKVRKEWTEDKEAHWHWYLTNNWDNDAYECKTGRVYGTWSRVPRELRGTFLINGEHVVEVDVKSAQPTCLVNLYPDRCARECQQFIQIIQEGRFYEEIMEHTGIVDRDA